MSSIDFGSEKRRRQLSAAVATYIGALRSSDQVCICCWFSGGRFHCARSWPRRVLNRDYPMALTSCRDSSPVACVVRRLLWDFEESARADTVNELARRFSDLAGRVACQYGRRRLVNASRLWNWADGLDDGCERFWAILARVLPDCFRDPSDVNSIRFAYAGEERGQKCG